MQRDLKLSSADYSLAVSIFFVGEHISVDWYEAQSEGYLCLQVPSNMILSKTKPRLYLPAIMVSGQLSALWISTKCQFIWGCLVIAYVGVNSKKALIGLRLVLGIVEAGFFVSQIVRVLETHVQPGILLYMSFWYKKMELARRFSVFYSASLIAGAFGGLLGEQTLLSCTDNPAGAILAGMDGVKGLPAWKWLFLSEQAS
jgi:hypothetical protein